MNGTTVGRKYVISASRRTDMVACQPDHLAALLRGESKQTKRLRPELIHTLLVSTKDYRPLLDNTSLRQLATKCDQVCLNLTVTGFGGTILEPQVPPAEVLLSRLRELANFVGDARRITWCFDPVFRWKQYSNISEEMFHSIASHFAEAGIKRVMAMFYHPYGNARINPEIPPMADRREFAERVDNMCVDMGLELSFCHVPGLHKMKCVDLQWYCTLHPAQDRSILEHYLNVKKCDASYCRDAIWDIGWYLPPCKHGCLYCYAVAERHSSTGETITRNNTQHPSCISSLSL